MIIFDHLAKTAGTALAQWMKREFGEQNVAWVRYGDHARVLEQRGAFKVCAGHIYFGDGEDLDDTILYTTVLRDPVDRAISWLFFALNNPFDEDMTETKEDCRRFIDGATEDLCDNVRLNLSNPCTDHFKTIGPAPGPVGEDLVLHSISILKRYALIGIYTRLDEFVRRFAQLGGHGSPRFQLTRENVTIEKPPREALSARLISHITEINQLDIALYKHFVEVLYPAQQQQWRRANRWFLGRRAA